MNRGWIYLAGAAILAYFAKNVYKQEQAAVASKDVLTPAQRAFVNSVLKYAPDIKAKYGIQPAILVSQAALESGYGTSGLTRQANNLFGMKPSKAWLADKKPLWTGMTTEFINGVQTPVKDSFKKYGSWKESIYDWAELISKTYKTAYGYAKAGDVTGYGQAIVDFGYSTHPQYASLITGEFRKIATA